jgi:4-hydroxy-tetrahydrodipicolinate reductase
MRIMLIGYGKMGKAIESIAIERGHSVPVKIDYNNASDLKNITNQEVDIAIEFTQPESALHNIKTCIHNSIPLVCGTTGWLQHKKEIEALCDEKQGSFFYASNYSVGVNLFFQLNKLLAKIMNNYPSYKVSMEEIHHTEKKDAPSGTAITLAEGIIENHVSYQQWESEQSSQDGNLPIFSKRIGLVPGTHTVQYDSEIDSIEIKHTAHTRHGFALGAVVAAEWLFGKKGVFGMEDMLNFKA